MESAQRKKIRGTLVNWLHGFVGANPRADFTTSIGQCYEISGSSFAGMPSHKFALKKALEELAAYGVIESWHYDRELVIIQRSASPSNDRIRSAKPVAALA